MQQHPVQQHRMQGHRVIGPDEKEKGAHFDASSARGRLSPQEEATLVGLCAIYAARILGMYLVLPVLSPYAHGLRGATNLWIGFALGAYGLTQGLLQIPFGFLSDRIGRKQAISIGLVLFALGGAVAAVAKDVRILVLGRLIQGSGAVAAAVVASIADLTRVEVRTQAMARVGLWFGASLAFGLIAGPPLAARFGVPALFWASVALGFAGAVWVTRLAPSAGPGGETQHPRAREIRWVLRQPSLIVLDAGVFLIHAALTVLFVVLPYRWSLAAGIGGLWRVTLPLVVLGLLAMAGSAHWAERYQRTREAFLLGVVLLVLSSGLLAAFGDGTRGTAAAVVLFVAGLALLEPALPAITSRYAAGPYRGTAIGVFHATQFIGSFLGGLLGGAFLHSGIRGLFGGFAACFLVWLYAVVRAGVTRGP